MKTTITKNTKENGCKVYTLKHENKIICACSDYNKILHYQKYYNKILTN